MDAESRRHAAENGVFTIGRRRKRYEITAKRDGRGERRARRESVRRRKKRRKEGKMGRGCAGSPAPASCLPLELRHFVQKLIRSRNHSRAGLKAPLRNNHIRELLGEIHAR